MKKAIQFDFEEAKKYHSPEKIAWLKKYHNKLISEDVFVMEMKNLKKFSLAKRKRSHKYSPSRLRSNYKKLKEKFGFFK